MTTGYQIKDQEGLHYLTFQPEDYLYSSARNYATMEAIMDVPVLSLPWHTY